MVYSESWREVRVYISSARSIYNANACRRESFKLSLGFNNVIIRPDPNGSIVGVEKDNDQDCDILVYIDAPGFEIGDNPRQLKIPPGRSEQFIAIEAKNAGTHEIVINSEYDHRVIGIYVLSNPFFSPSEMFVISGILAFLGPMALPWWIDYLRNHGQRRGTSKKSASLRARVPAEIGGSLWSLSRRAMASGRG